MASKKNAPQTAPATPFATNAGNVPGGTDYAGKRPTDFQKSATSQQAPRTGGRNFIGESRAQTPAEAPSPAAPVPIDNYGEGRVDASSIPAGGMVPRAVPTSSRGNAADAGPTPAHSPFKNLKG